MVEKIKNYFQNETIYFVTKHGKEQILSPLLLALDLSCVPVQIDTDIFGTFSGEVLRIGTVRETLRKKVQAAADILPDAKIFLASEGTFGPHPIIGFIKTDLESLLLWQKDMNVEIYAEYLCTNPIHVEKVFESTNDFRLFLKEIGFPEHGVIVRPEGMIRPIFKGLHREQDVEEAMLACFAASKNGKVILATDLRANHNPTRRNAIRKACLNLIEKLKSNCPRCEFPGFAIDKAVPGLPCADCGKPSQTARALMWACVKCDYTEERPLPDGKLTVNCSECEFCNP